MFSKDANVSTIAPLATNATDAVQYTRRLNLKENPDLDGDISNEVLRQLVSLRCVANTDVNRSILERLYISAFECVELTQSSGH